MSGRHVTIVPHTHWDREWYSPFQTFRLRLVDLLDDLLPRLDADQSYAHFMLDGQMAVVDDYLAVRPEAEETLRRLAASGRLSVGPWYILMDEFLASGETTVRNLQRGIDRAAAFGGAMEVGYLPDMFGHIAQMPQLLTQFGFEHAVVWRGVPSAVNRSGFWWSAPDGSTVRAEYLCQGYGNGARVPEDAKAMIEQIHDFDDSWGELLTGPVLWMNGTDHLMPQPWLGRVVAEANAAQDDYELVVGSLASHLAHASTTDLPSWTGELRSGARANLLFGVTSNRIDVRVAAARAERALEQEAEPLSALFLPAERWPAALLDEAWLSLIRNSAHDSICACSADEVCDAVLHRYAEARQIASGLRERACAALGASVSARLPLVINPSPRTRGGIVDVIVPGNDDIPGTQIIERRTADVVVTEMEVAGSAAVLVRELKYNTKLLSIALESVESGEVLWQTERDGDGELFAPGVRRELDDLVASSPPGRVRIRITRPPTQRLLARIDDVPGYGWREFAAAPLEHPVTVENDGRVIDNGLVRIEINDDGQFSVNGLDGFGRIVQGGDVGDTYNWCPPEHDVEIDRPVSVTVESVDTGPVVARSRIVSTYCWPESVNGEPVDVEVVTTLEVRASETLVHATTAWRNRYRDQRVRAWFPLPEPASESHAGCAFAVITRGLTAEGGPTEDGLPQFPARRLVQAGGLTVVFEGVMEYELVDVDGDRAAALALTLARCTGMLSQGPMTTRPLPAGPMDPLEGSQLSKPIEVRYGISIEPDADPYTVADELTLPLYSTRATGTDASGATTGQALDVDLGRAQVSSLRRHAGALELRVFNPTAEATTVSLGERTGWLVDLRGRPVAPFEGTVELAPWRIATLTFSR
jgi:alpha-mannosidase